MFKYLCLFALASGACAASIGLGLDVTTEKREVVPLLNFETEKNPDGSFHFTYEGGDKTFRQESGVVQNPGTEDEALEVSGSYRYIDADGNQVEVHYTAGKNGFVPVGTNILGEISALAKAAADLPNDPVEKESNRRARSKTIEVEKESETPVAVVVTENVPKSVVQETSASEVVEQKVAEVVEKNVSGDAKKPVIVAEEKSASEVVEKTAEVVEKTASDAVKKTANEAEEKSASEVVEKKASDVVEKKESGVVEKKESDVAEKKESDVVEKKESDNAEKKKIIPIEELLVG